MVRLSDALRMSKRDEEDDDDESRPPSMEVPDELDPVDPTGPSDEVGVPPGEEPENVRPGYKPPDDKWYGDKKGNKGKKWRIGMGRWWKTKAEIDKASVVKKRK